ncbi:MAG: exonuclease SbcCD subunit D [Thermoleophilia bacterium]
MKLIHTADWHLGRLFHGFHLTEDQAHVLEQLVELAREVRADAVVVAGDVYDRAVPPPEAVSLLDWTLSELTLSAGIPVVLIAGNHDSPERLGFGRRVLEGGRMYVRGRATSDCRPIILEDESGPVQLCPLPFLEPAWARQVFENPDLHDHGSALGAYVDLMRGRLPAGVRSVAVAHAFVGGGEESESERPLSVGTAGLVDVEVFRGFEYAALGHLHRPQSVGSERVRYAGSLLKYSASEAGHDKSVSLVEIDGQGKVRVEPIALRPRRDVRIVEGELRELLEGDRERWGDPRDYLHVRLLDRGPLLEPAARLREVFPNLLAVERVVSSLGPGPRRETVDPRTLDESLLFADFFKQATGSELTEDEKRELDAVVEQVRGEEREAG